MMTPLREELSMVRPLIPNDFDGRFGLDSGIKDEMKILKKKVVLKSLLLCFMLQAKPLNKLTFLFLKAVLIHQQ